jgi:hypothetical protein
MTNPSDHIEIITSAHRRRRWIASEKLRAVQADFAIAMKDRKRAQL